jgi:hypothetical protein
MLVRNTVALDIEATTFYRIVAEFPGVRALLVKGVSDYADQDKNDAYHDYASAVSAAYILSFVKEYLTSDRILGLRARLLRKRIYTQRASEIEVPTATRTGVPAASTATL